MLLLLFFYTSLGQASVSSVAETAFFSFTSFYPDTCSKGSLLCLNSASAANGYLNLTPDPELGNSSSPTTLPINRVGRVLYPHPVIAWHTLISTTFTVRISVFPNSSGPGDGMAFIIAPDNSSSPPESYGSSVGILDQSASGGCQVAVELDTFKNEFDPDGNHIGINIKSMQSVVAKSLNSTGIDLKSGKDIQVKIDYNGWTKMLQVSVAFSGNPLMSFLNQSIDLKDLVPNSVYVGFTAATGLYSERHQLLNWMFQLTALPSPKEGTHRHDKIKFIVAIFFPFVTGLVILAVIIFPWMKRILRRGKEETHQKTDIESRSRSAANVPKMFTYKQLAKATRNFHNENLLGSGGFASVYKGNLPFNPPTIVAVKKISATSKQGEKEYFAEICTIGRLRHKNIVQLQGWCHESKNLLLVYDYMPNGSLDRYIGKNDLDWKTRYNILTGLASALLYLHVECGNPVIHRDIKPNNIMLDSTYIAHLGDFGLARMLQDDASVRTVLAGTPGYLAPEVAFTGKATPESDIYSFGMVVIEVISGRRSKGIKEENSLVDCIWNLYGKNELVKGVDRLLEGKFDEEQARRTLIIGLACLHPDSNCRPNIRKVVQIFLNPNEPLMELPESRPNVVYLPISSSSASTTTCFGGSLLHPSVSSAGQISLHCDDTSPI
ncbi:probable L-type lectin-domain containing receptor kinase S.5 [Carica papaya]|uniref:probable L-type lectin-domain containing receptor kinase S.5 n=1 Tax=Carica papaya TaxID=3649 RepID=UPI000B8CFFB7|nr:probable L-type lectin-domain containing receptor kinase S.5 [Carica papaya]